MLNKFLLVPSVPSSYSFPQIVCPQRQHLDIPRLIFHPLAGHCGYKRWEWLGPFPKLPPLQMVGIALCRVWASFSTAVFSSWELIVENVPEVLWSQLCWIIPMYGAGLVSLPAPAPSKGTIRHLWLVRCCFKAVLFFVWRRAIMFGWWHVVEYKNISSFLAEK